MVCIFIPFLGCSYPICISLAASSILYIILQLYHQDGSGDGNVAARVEGPERAAIGKEETCSGSRVSLTPRTGSSSSLSVQVGLLAQPTADCDNIDPNARHRHTSLRLCPHIQRVASILTCLQVDVSSANQANSSSRPHMCIPRCGSCSLKPAVGGERGQGLCQVSTFYTTLVKMSQEGNGASELRRRPLP